MKLNLKELMGDAFHEGMTAEELLAAAADIEVPDDPKLATRLSEVNKESASRKRQLNEQKTTIEELTAQVTALTRENTIGKRTTALIGMGYGSAEAKSMATAIAALSDEEFEAFTTSHSNFLTEHDKSVTAARQAATPEPAPGRPGEPTALTRAERLSMTMEQLQAAYEKNPEGFASAD